MVDGHDDPAGGDAGLKAVQDRNPYAALGRISTYLMHKPSFAKLLFGAWMRTMIGQINRGHYFLVVDADKAVGFAGWALADEARAKAWASGGGDIDSKDCRTGDCMVINAWAADNDAVNMFIRRELRRRGLGLKAAYAKRFYEDGRVRPLRLGTTEAMASHVDKST